MANKAALCLADLTLRDMLTKDLYRVLVIERNAQVSPWSRLSFEESLTGAKSLIDNKPLTDKKSPAKANYCRVIEARGDIVAYHTASAVLDELHILNVVVAPPLQGKGLGHVLMQDIIDLAKSKSLEKIFLEVRISNKVAQNLYLKWQFKQIALRKAYYSASSGSEAGREDALVYLRELKAA